MGTSARKLISTGHLGLGESHDGVIKAILARAVGEQIKNQYKMRERERGERRRKRENGCFTAGQHMEQLETARTCPGN